MWDGTVSGKEFNAESMAFLELWNSADTSRYHWQWQPWAESTAGGYLTLEDVPMSAAEDGGKNPSAVLTNSSAGANFRRECMRRNEMGRPNLKESDCLTDSVDSPVLQSDCEDDPEDAAALVVDPVSPNEHVSCTYHVIYNESYKAPTLFFRGSRSDGGLLSMQDVQRILTPDSVLLLETSPWTFLTQEEHPALHRPWLLFHPCGTSKMMALILSDWLRSRQNLSRAQERQTLSSGDVNPSQPEQSPFSGHYLLTWLSIVGQVARLDLPLELFKKLSNATYYHGH